MFLKLFDIDEFDEVYELFCNSFVVEVKKEDCFERISKLVEDHHFKIFVVKENDVVLGAAIVNVHEDPFKKANFATLWYYAVLKSWQGKGVGTYLLQEICEYLKKEGIVSVRLTTSQTNFSCQKSSEKAGFEKRVSYKKLL